MKKRILTTALLAGTFAICLAAVVADLSGKWKGSFKMGDGRELPLTYVFKVDGEKLIGTITSSNGDLPIYDGKVKGADFSFKVDVNDRPLLNTGKYYGDSTTIDVTFGDRKIHSKLLRAKE